MGFREYFFGSREAEQFSPEVAELNEVKGAEEELGQLRLQTQAVEKEIKGIQKAYEEGTKRLNDRMKGRPASAEDLERVGSVTHDLPILSDRLKDAKRQLREKLADFVLDLRARREKLESQGQSGSLLDKKLVGVIREAFDHIRTIDEVELPVANKAMQEAAQNAATWGSAPADNQLLGRLGNDVNSLESQRARLDKALEPKGDKGNSLPAEKQESVEEEEIAA